jgi:hypothetical protein
MGRGTGFGHSGWKGLGLMGWGRSGQRQGIWTQGLERAGVDGMGQEFSDHINLYLASSCKK